MRIIAFLLCLGTVLSQESAKAGSQTSSQVAVQVEHTMEQAVVKAEQSEQVMADKAAAATQTAARLQAKAQEAAAAVSHDKQDEALKNEEIGEQKKAVEDLKTEAADSTNQVDRSDELSKASNDEATVDKLEAGEKAIAPKLAEDVNASATAAEDAKAAKERAAAAERAAARTTKLAALEQEAAQAAGDANDALNRLSDMANKLRDEDSSDERIVAMSDDIVHQAAEGLKAAKANAKDEIAADQNMIQRLQANSTANMTRDEVREIRKQEHELRKRIAHSEHEMKHLDAEWEVEAMKDGCKHARRNRLEELNQLYHESRDATGKWMRASRSIAHLEGSNQDDVDMTMAAEEMRAHAKQLAEASHELAHILFSRVCGRVHDHADKMKMEIKQQRRMAKQLERAQKANEHASERMEEAREAAQELAEGKKEQAAALNETKSTMSKLDLYIQGLSTKAHDSNSVMEMADKFRAMSQQEFDQKKSELQKVLQANVAKLQKLASEKDVAAQNATMERLLQKEWDDAVDAIRDDKEKLNDLSRKGTQEAFEDAVKDAEHEEKDLADQHRDAVKAAIEDYKKAAKKVKEAKKKSGLDDSYWEGDYETTERQWDSLERTLDEKVRLKDDIVHELYASIEDSRPAAATATTTAYPYTMLPAQGSRATLGAFALVFGFLAATFGFTRRSMPYLSQQPLLG